MSKLWVLVFLAAEFAKAQFGFGLGFGVKGGYSFTDSVSTNSVGSLVPGFKPPLATTDNYIVGPVAELRLPLGFAAEVDGLYRRSQYNATLPALNALGYIIVPYNANSWEVPYMLKWRFPIPVLKPFISGGGAYRTFTNVRSDVGGNPIFPVSHHGGVGAVGLELRLARLRLSGEVRYYRWQKVSNPGFELNPNQGEVLFGIMF
jgi:hypothetical protein